MGKIHKIGRWKILKKKEKGKRKEGVIAHREREREMGEIYRRKECVCDDKKGEIRSRERERECLRYFTTCG